MTDRCINRCHHICKHKCLTEMMDSCVVFSEVTDRCSVLTEVTSRCAVFTEVTDRCVVFTEEKDLVSWCFKPSQPQRITSGLKEKDRCALLSDEVMDRCANRSDTQVYCAYRSDRQVCFQK